jgi:hypothetical protein
VNELFTQFPEVDEKRLPFAIEEFGDQCWVYGSDIPHGDCLYGAVDIFLKRDDVSEESKRKLRQCAFTGSKSWKCIVVKRPCQLKADLTPLLTLLLVKPGEFGNSESGLK